MNNSPRLAAGAVVAALLLSGCVAPGHQAVPPAPACRTGDPLVQTTLYFGLNRPAGPAITAAEWQTFVDSQVTPRFKDGLTVFDAKGSGWATMASWRARTARRCC